MTFDFLWMFCISTDHVISYFIQKPYWGGTTFRVLHVTRNKKKVPCFFHLKQQQQKNHHFVQHAFDTGIWSWYLPKHWIPKMQSALSPSHSPGNLNHKWFSLSVVKSPQIRKVIIKKKRKKNSTGKKPCEWERPWFIFDNRMIFTLICSCYQPPCLSQGYYLGSQLS